MKHQKCLPDVLLIRKFYSEKKKKNRIWKLKRLEIDEGEGGMRQKNAEKKKKMDLEEFHDEIEQDKNLRRQMHLYRDEEGIKAKLAKRTQDKKLKENKQTMDDANDDDSDWESDPSANEIEDGEMVKLGELMADMNLQELDEKDEAKMVDDLIRDMDNVEIKK